MIQIRFEEREKIGLQYILESLHGCSPFGQERIRRLRSKICKLLIKSHFWFYWNKIKTYICRPVISREQML